MIHRFENDEAAYLGWVNANPAGFVVNVDVAARYPQYPMVHRATHKLISSAARTNYTSNEYIKLCSTDLVELERMAPAKYGKPLNRCATCMGASADKSKRGKVG